jgi:hypothetical protein
MVRLGTVISTVPERGVMLVLDSGETLLVENSGIILNAPLVTKYIDQIVRGAPSSQAAQIFVIFIFGIVFFVVIAVLYATLSNVFQSIREEMIPASSQNIDYLK